MIVFPRKAGKGKKGDASEEEVKKAKSGEGIIASAKAGLPIVNIPRVTEAKISEEKGEDSVYKKLRLARSEARLIGKREKRVKTKEDEAAAAKK